MRGTPPSLLGVTHISVRGGGHAYAIRAVLMLRPGHDVARSAWSIGLCSARSHAPAFPQSLIKMSLHDSRAENPAWYGLGQKSHKVSQTLNPVPRRREISPKPCVVDGEGHRWKETRTRCMENGQNLCVADR